MTYAKDPLTGNYITEGFGRTVRTNTFTYSGLSKEKTYKFEVTPYEKSMLDESSGLSNDLIYQAVPAPSEPSEPTEPSDNGNSSNDNNTEESTANAITFELSGQTLKTSWLAVENADRYRVQLYKKASTGLYVREGSSKATNSNSHTFTNLDEGEYKVVVEPRIKLVYDTKNPVVGFLTIGAASSGEEVGEQPTSPGTESNQGSEGSENTNEGTNTGSEETSSTAFQAFANVSKVDLTWDTMTIDGKTIESYKINRYSWNVTKNQFVKDSFSRSVTGNATTDTSKLVSGTKYRYELVPRVGSIYDTKHTITTEVTMN